ncbi:ImmA/IrrE family metallo-endopeptidase [Nodosilinea sp. LEGE 07088]|uniref:ImmA/IrrE family metallo-endopeptidase n=1 Tax=Nodosilinea sp. LEGE 07088 TaxID=2777968 RepID=UPI001882FA7E|nr:ImmA/IrrE family metallo-endopeptidase [Nodosilinea sp. LEGE 07088]MBE9135732.1 ImmA/IrrE family metallo-endopeptidase [Nodosilinea sp. LEGE 07088]
MANLLERLEEKGLQAKYVRDRALPTWWDADLEDDPTVVAEAAGYIAKRLGLDIASVFSPEAEIAFKGQAQAKFKKRQDTSKQSLEVVQGLASRVAELVSYAVLPSYHELRKDAAALRQGILARGCWVNLDSLLALCWQHGIPVVHFSPPQGTKKIDGMVASFNGRLVIVICCARKAAAWLAFILAHELGHILAGHVQEQFYVDESITQEEQDPEELEANAIAATLLLGNPNNYEWRARLYPNVLVTTARRFSRRDNVDPGIVCLNYGWKRDIKEEWGIAGKALKTFEPIQKAPNTINQHLIHNLDWERLDRDSQEYLRLVIGA